MARASLRENLITAAVEQFHIHGYAAAGVKDITDAAGAPKGSFYNHFESKEALAVGPWSATAPAVGWRPCATTRLRR
ncbi:TetR/AcrR family transcriptional regulator [Streptomyces sp. NBC_00873]|uniref:TetR family transcriptional regulator n=1 Tax=unclassified Streptomyces TaxID=2593676 RepID=UPI003868F545|nr:TetR/AcrR family transcriptional regulator [Streptomyces sp. NBC_00873]WTA48152.1 TetR/AcrR family transcriptional regulator [Streptomyces sp. NBC_00842]